MNFKSDLLQRSPKPMHNRKKIRFSENLSGRTRTACLDFYFLHKNIFFAITRARLKYFIFIFFKITLNNLSVNFVEKKEIWSNVE